MSQWITLMMFLLPFWVLNMTNFSCQWRDRLLSDFIKNTFMCALKMNESLTGLKRHEGE